MGIPFPSFQISGNVPHQRIYSSKYRVFEKDLETPVSIFITYAIIAICFVMVENFDGSFYFMFSADYMRERVISKLSKGR